MELDIPVLALSQRRQGIGFSPEIETGTHSSDGQYRIPSPGDWLLA